MANPFDKIVDIIIAILIMFLFPLLYFGLHQDNLTEQVLKAETAEFMNTVRTQGYLTKSMYETYLGTLDATGNIYDINLEHKELSLEPEYRFKTTGEIIEEQNSKWTGNNSYHFVPVTTAIPAITDPVNNDGLMMNTETNESILASAVKTPTSGGHVHGTACYGDHVHSNHLVLDHVHSSSCYCTGTITSVVSTGSGGDGDASGYHTWRTYKATCGSCGYSISFKEDAYSTSEKYGTAQAANGVYTINGVYHAPYSSIPKVGDRCNSPNPVCGQDSGVINCYAPAMTVVHSSGSGASYYTIYCGRCGSPLYYISFVNTGDYYVEITNCSTGQSYKQGSGANYATVYNNLYAFCDWLTSFQSLPSTTSYAAWKKDSGMSWGDTAYSIPAGKFTYDVPYLGCFNGCAFCTDFICFNENGNSSTWSVSDLDSGIKIATFSSGSTTDWLTLYKNGVNDGSYSRSYVGGTTTMTADMYNFVSKIGTSLNGWDNTYISSRGDYYTNGWSWIQFNKSSGMMDYSFLNNVLNNGSIYGNVNTFCNVKVPLCYKIIKSIQPTHPIQCIYLGEPLITTAKVTYLDDSTEIIRCSTNFNVNALGKNQTATLSYDGYYTAYTTKTFTTTVDVTVIPKTKNCVNGHTYNLRSDGSDPGCPYCDGWLRSLTVTNPDTGEISIFRGTTLTDNGVEVTAIYLNGRKEILYAGYANNLDKYYVGIQTVTIGYKGKTTTLKVTVKKNLKKCDVCGRYYELYPDDTDPGCPYCKARVPVFTGNVLKYYDKTYSKEILEEIYERSGTYYFKAGDYLDIEVTNRNKTIGTRLLGSVIPNLPETSVKVEYGGEIRDDTVLGEH